MLRSADLLQKLPTTFWPVDKVPFSIFLVAKLASISAVASHHEWHSCHTPPPKCLSDHVDVQGLFMAWQSGPI